jgi:hypothetical protein
VHEVICSVLAGDHPSAAISTARGKDPTVQNCFHRLGRLETVG